MPRSWNDIPFAPRTWPFFYGWALLGACAVGTLCSIPGQTIGVGVFAPHLREALGLTQTQLSASYMFGTIASSLLLPYAGDVLDRLGARWMVVVAALGQGASLCALAGLGFAGLGGGSWGLAGPMAAGFVVFLLLRFFGQGCLTMVSRVTIGKWFDHHRGMATAFLSVAISFGFNSSPQFLNALVRALTWEGAAFALAGVTGVGMALLGWVFYRDNPEACGLVMDGITDRGKLARLARHVAPTRHEFTRGEALRTLSFWVFSLSAGVQSLVMTAVAFHIAAIGAERGLTNQESFSVFLPTAAFAVPTTLIGGWVSDRVRLKWLLFVMLTAQALALTGLLQIDHGFARFLFTLGYGVSGGLFALVITVTWPRYYGRLHLGAISGVNTSILVFSSAIGPVLFSAGRDLTGSFTAVTALCWLMPVAMLLAAVPVRNPQRAWPGPEAGDG